MTRQQEANYIQAVLPFLLSGPVYLSEEDSPVALRPSNATEYHDVAKRLLSEGLVTTYGAPLFLSITSKGKVVAEEPGGYLGYLASEKKAAFWERFRANATVWATVISAAAAVASAGIAYYLSNSLDKTNAQVEALNQRVQALATQLAHYQHAQAQQPQPKADQRTQQPARSIVVPSVHAGAKK